MVYAVIGLVVLLLLVLASCIKIVPQAQAFILERLGAYQETWSVGIHFKIPFIDRVARRVNLKEQVADFPPQPVITKDNVTMRIDTVVFYQITDPRLFTYGVENPMMAIENLTSTTLRNVIGDLELGKWLYPRLLALPPRARVCAIYHGMVDRSSLPRRYSDILCGLGDQYAL